jgi:hypothetical protein
LQTASGTSGDGAPSAAIAIHRASGVP